MIGVSYLPIANRGTQFVDAFEVVESALREEGKETKARTNERSCTVNLVHAQYAA
jgi:hypothetical protein